MAPAIRLGRHFGQVIGIRFEAGCIFQGKNTDDARCGFRRRKINAYDASIGDRALNERAVHKLRPLKFCRVHRRAGNLSVPSRRISG